MYSNWLIVMQYNSYCIKCRHYHSNNIEECLIYNPKSKWIKTVTWWSPVLQLCTSTIKAADTCYFVIYHCHSQSGIHLSVYGDSHDTKAICYAAVWINEQWTIYCIVCRTIAMVIWGALRGGRHCRTDLPSLLYSCCSPLEMHQALCHLHPARIAPPFVSWNLNLCRPLKKFHW